MKKSFVVEFEYDEDADDVAGTFGIKDGDDWQDRIGKYLNGTGNITITADLVAGLESGAISGADLMGLACGGGNICYRRTN